MRRTLFTAIALLVATACQSSTEPYVNVRVETSVVPASSTTTPMDVITTVTNGSNRVISLNGGTCPANFRVETVAGVEVAPRSQICSAIFQPIALAPGEFHRFQERWDGTDSAGVRLTGTYRIIGQPFSTSGPQSAPVTVQLAQ